MSTFATPGDDMWDRLIREVVWLRVRGESATYQTSAMDENTGEFLVIVADQIWRVSVKRELL